MTATDNEAMSALHELLDERQRYQGWLTTLEGRRNSTPPHVYERVQQDYVGRLDRVMQSLTERAGQLSGTIASMTSDLATLRQHESDRTDERHEAELRAAVGEFTPDDWERRRAEADGDLEQIVAERHSLQGELEELQRIVALTGAVKPDSARSQLEAEGSSAAASSSSGRARPDESPQSIDEFVAEWHPLQVQANSKDRAAQTRGSDAAYSDHVADAADMNDMVIGAAPMGGNPVGAAGADYGIANGVTGVTSAGGTPGGAAPARSAQPTQSTPGDVRRDTDKTLKCPECGAMNYATEWYCEKCGGELSTF
jgi:predicted  nucleic acid-binding Zn-ribbon protein